MTYKSFSILFSSFMSHVGPKQNIYLSFYCAKFEDFEDFEVVLSVTGMLVDLFVAIMQVTVSVAIMHLDVSAAIMQMTVSAANMWVTIFIAIMQMGVSIAFMQVVFSAVDCGHDRFYCNYASDIQQLCK